MTLQYRFGLGTTFILLLVLLSTFLPEPAGSQTAPVWRWDGIGQGDGFGFFVGKLGDTIDPTDAKTARGDGIPDIVIGRACDGSNCPAKEGSVSIYSGRDFSLIFRIGGTASSYVVDAGDRNGDGIPDLLVADSLTSAKARLYSGVDGSLISGLTGDEVPGAMGRTAVTIDRLTAGCGSPVFVGDLNGDGRPEAAVAAMWASPGGRTNAGSISILDGATGMPMSRYDRKGAMRFDGEAPGDYLGGAPGQDCEWIRLVGDLNGDGYPDFMTGAPGADVDGMPDTGRVLIFSGYDASVLLRIDNPDPAATPHYFGVDGDVVGGWDGNGPVKVVIGAGDPFFGSPEMGSAFLFHLLPGTVPAISNDPSDRSSAVTTAGIAIDRNSRVPTGRAVTDAAAKLLISGNGIWRTTSVMATLREKLAAGAIRGALYAISEGGNPRSITVEIYDPVSDTWKTAAPLPSVRRGASITLVGDTLYVVAGTDGRRPLPTAEIYNSVNDTWRTTAPMSQARTDISLGAVGDFLYVVGGADAGGPLAVMEAYDPVSNRWSVKAPMVKPRIAPIIGSVSGILYALEPIPGTSFASLESYNSLSDAWTAKSPVPVAQTGPMVGVDHGTLFMGEDNGNGSLASVKAYDPLTDTWTRQDTGPHPSAW